MKLILSFLLLLSIGLCSASRPLKDANTSDNASVVKPDNLEIGIGFGKGGMGFDVGLGDGPGFGIDIGGGVGVGGLEGDVNFGGHGIYGGGGGGLQFGIGPDGPQFSLGGRGGFYGPYGGYRGYVPDNGYGPGYRGPYGGYGSGGGWVLNGVANKGLEQKDLLKNEPQTP
ncbi:hypothetical protein FRX31_016356, partial [Thalictrum thalictroides]